MFHDHSLIKLFVFKSFHATAEPINIGAKVAVKKGARIVLNHSPTLFNAILKANFNAEVLLAGKVFHSNFSS